MTERARAIIAIALGIAMLLALGLAVKSCQSRNTVKTEAKLATGQADAAIKSGNDAVQTIGNRSAADATGDAITRENDDAIRNADGASAPVAPPVRDAGIASLCRRASHQRDPKCVQLAHSR